MALASLLLVDLRSPINFGMCLRLAETFAMDVLVFDPSGLTADTGKRQTISDFACGALERKGFTQIADLNLWTGAKSARAGCFVNRAERCALGKILLCRRRRHCGRQRV